MLYFGKFLFLTGKVLLLVCQTVLRVVEFLFASAKILLALVESYFALLEFVFNLRNTLVALLHFFFEFGLFVEKLFLDFKEFLFLDDVGFLVGTVDHAVVLLLKHIAEEAVPCCGTNKKSNDEIYEIHVGVGCVNMI